MREDGFSLIEILISFFLLLIIVITSLHIIIASLLIKKNSELNFLFTRIAVNKLEYLKSYPFESIELNPGVYSEEVELPNIKTKLQLSWKIDKISKNLKRIGLEIWLKNHPEKKAEFVIYISRNLGF